MILQRIGNRGIKLGTLFERAARRHPDNTLTLDHRPSLAPQLEGTATIAAVAPPSTTSRGGCGPLELLPVKSWSSTSRTVSTSPWRHAPPRVWARYQCCCLPSSTVQRWQR